MAALEDISRAYNRAVGGAGRRGAASPSRAKITLTRELRKALNAQSMRHYRRVRDNRGQRDWREDRRSEKRAWGSRLIISKLGYNVDIGRTPMLSCKYSWAAARFLCAGPVPGGGGSGGNGNGVRGIRCLAWSCRHWRGKIHSPLEGDTQRPRRRKFHREHVEWIADAVSAAVAPAAGYSRWP